MRLKLFVIFIFVLIFSIPSTVQADPCEFVPITNFLCPARPTPFIDTTTTTTTVQSTTTTTGSTTTTTSGTSVIANTQKPKIIELPATP